MKTEHTDQEMSYGRQAYLSGQKAGEIFNLLFISEEYDGLVPEPQDPYKTLNNY